MPRHPCAPFSVHPPQTLHPTLPHPSQHQSRQGEDSRDTMGLPHAKSLPCTVPSLAFPMPAHPAHAPALPGRGTVVELGPGNASLPGSMGTWTLLYFSLLFRSIKHWICWVVARGHGQGMGAVGSTPSPAHMAQAPPLHELACPTSVTPRVYLTPHCPGFGVHMAAAFRHCGEEGESVGCPRDMGSVEEGQKEGRQEQGQGCGTDARGRAPLAAVSVGLDAGSVGHDMGYIGLLLHPMEEVGHGALGQDGHILTAMGLRVEGHSRLWQVLEVHWGGERRG